MFHDSHIYIMNGPIYSFFTCVKPDLAYCVKSFGQLFVIVG